MNVGDRLRNDMYDKLSENYRDLVHLLEKHGTVRYGADSMDLIMYPSCHNIHIHFLYFLFLFFAIVGTAVLLIGVFLLRNP